MIDTCCRPPKPRVVDRFPGYSLVLDLGITVSETPALFFVLDGGHFRFFRGLQKGFQFF